MAKPGTPNQSDHLGSGYALGQGGSFLDSIAVKSFDFAFPIGRTKCSRPVAFFTPIQNNQTTMQLSRGETYPLIDLLN